MKTPTSVAVCQVQLVFGDIEANLGITSQAILEATERGAQVVVLPELANSGYHFRDREEAASVAETVSGPTVSAWLELARRTGAVIVGGICELDEAGLVRNSSVVVDETGLRDVYRKTHLWDRETLIFEPGHELPRVVETAHGRIATLICYDIEFPEWVRHVALGGADLVAVPTNWPRMDTPPGERPFMVAIVQAMAETNGVFFAVSDRARSAERGHEFSAASVIVGPDGYPRASLIASGASGTTIVSCDLSSAREKAVGPFNDIFGDRRVDLYAGP